MKNMVKGKQSEKESVVQNWISDLSFKQQSVLLCVLRGCDMAAKKDPSKEVLRYLRKFILKDACGYGTFMSHTDTTDTGLVDKHYYGTCFDDMLLNLDHYPVHWIMHLTHTLEILGYKYPDLAKRELFHNLYTALCRAFHLNPETEEELDLRLFE